MASSLKEEIQNALIARLQTIKAANGYDTDVDTVYVDDIPMGLSLDSHELPAILVVGGDDKLKREGRCLYGNWAIEMQLIHDLVDDATMHRFVRDVNKAIFANHPTAPRTDAFRIHPAVYEIWLENIDSDLNMLEANRMFFVHFMIGYKSFPYNL